MSLIIHTENMDFEEMPTGEGMIRCYQIYDLGYQRSPEGNIPRRELVFLFELESSRRDGKPFTITQRFSASMHPKAKLRAFIESWRGGPYQDDEVRQYDISLLVGHYGFATIVKKTQGNNKDWFEIFSIRPKGPAKPFLTRMQQGYVPEWVSKAISKQVPAPELQNTQQNTGPQDMTPRPAGSSGTVKYTPPDNRMEF